jgi:hypothetical protein
MDNNIESKLFLNKSPKKLSDKRMFLQYKINIEKIKSEDMNSFNFKNTLNNKSNKIPSNIRSTYQGKILLSNIFNSNNGNNINFGKKDITNTNREKSIKKDKNYYLNILNDIYLNESHLSNKKASKKQNSINSKNDFNKVNKNFVKKKTYNFTKIGDSSKNLLRKSYKSSKKVLSTFINEKINKSNRLSNNGSKDNIDKSNRSNRKQSNFSKNLVNKKPLTKFLSEKFTSKFRNNEELSKVKMKESFKNLKSSQNYINEVEYMNETLKDDKKEGNENKKTMIKEIKPITVIINNNENQMENNKGSRNDENDNLERCNTKKNSNRNINNNKSNKVKEAKKMHKTCFFCCLIKNDDSLSDNN